MTSTCSRVFFAIPCGGFYDLQAASIKNIAKSCGLDAVIAEDDISTKELWPKITSDIDRCDLFVADISSGSQNIAFELGYALARKPADRIGIFVAESIAEPSDLRGYLLQKYRSLSDFSSRLSDWLQLNAAVQYRPRSPAVRSGRPAYLEEFRDLDRFLRLWSVPPGAAFHMTGDGLKVGDAHFPILTKQLGLIRDCEFEFTARIDRRQIGWSVYGTQRPQELFPTFCVMFALRSDGRLSPHVFNAAQPGPHGGYHRFDEKRTKISLARDERGWFTVITRVRGHRIEVVHQGNVVFDADFSEAPFKEVYASAQRKQGNVGFRCYPGEEATVARVVVREVEMTPKKYLQPAAQRRSKRRG